MPLRCRAMAHPAPGVWRQYMIHSSMNWVRPLRSCTGTGLLWRAFCGMWHTVLELMLLSIQLLSIQLSSTAAFNFVDCGILWNAALNTEYSVVLLSIQRFAAFHPRCHSDHWRVWFKNHMWSCQLGWVLTYMHSYIHGPLWAPPVGVLRCVNQGYIETPTYIRTYIHLYVLRITWLHMESSK